MVRFALCFSGSYVEINSYYVSFVLGHHRDSFFFFFFFFHCKLNTRRCGGLQSQGINSAISSLMFFCPGMKMVVLGNGYFYTTICSLRTGLRPPVAYH